MAYRSIYVAATSQHVGKTTSTLGLVAAFHKEGVNVGYCKPVGQKHISVDQKTVDKDTILFADLLHFDLEPAIHSPVILGKGATEMYLDNPGEYDVTSMIMHSKKKLDEAHDLVIYEGTGHPGVGSVADLSNAAVAKMLDAHVIMVVEGGIGSTIDQLNMTTALFREEGVKVAGVIINKVYPSKIEKITSYVKKWLDRKDLKLFGVVPYDATLAYPLIWTVSKAIDAQFEYYNERGYNRVAEIIAGSLFDRKDLEGSNELLLVVSSRVAESAIDKLEEITKQQNIEECPLSGIVLTGDYQISKKCIAYIEDNKLPVVRTKLDTYGVVIKISKLEVKINRQTPWKISKAIGLIQKNVNTELIQSEFRID